MTLDDIKTRREEQQAGTYSNGQQGYMSTTCKRGATLHSAPCLKLMQAPGQWNSRRGGVRSSSRTPQVREQGNMIQLLAPGAVAEEQPCVASNDCKGRVECASRG